MEAKIRRQLGARAERFGYKLAGVERDGWRAPAGGKAKAADEDATARRVDEMRRALRDDDVRVFLGDGGRTVYALPGLAAADVIEVMKVGSHNDGAKPRDVKEVVERVGVPFDVTFADEAGLEVVFGGKLSPAQARVLVEAVYAHEWLDSYTMMAEEGCELETEGELDAEEHAEAVTFVLHKNGVRLWWD